MKLIRFAVITALIFTFIANNSFAKNIKPALTTGKVYEIVKVSPAVEGQMTEFFFKDDKGTEHSIKSITGGKYVFLNFWGTWCPPCRAEIPAIIELQTELKDKNFVVIGVAMERAEPSEAIKIVSEFAKSKNINYFNFVPSNELRNDLVNSYKGIPYVPTTFLVDKTNAIFEKVQGGKTKAEFKSSIEKMMK